MAMKFSVLLGISMIYTFFPAQGSDVKPTFLVANPDGISIREAKTGQMRFRDPTNIPGSVHVRVDYDWRDRYLYWQGGTRNNYEISRIAVDTLKKETLISLPIHQTPVSFAVDWVHKLIYWIDFRIITSGSNINCYHKLHVSQVDGNYRKTLHAWSSLADDYGRLIVDPFKKYVYYTTRNGIQKIGMDGRGHKIIDNTHVNSLALDYSTDRLYYMSTTGLSSIFTNGTGKQNNLTPYILTNPLVVYKDNIFLGVYEFQKYRLNDNKYIMRYNLNDGSFTKISDTTRMTDFKVYEASDQKQGDNPCLNNNGGCQNLCLPQSSSTYTCECADRWIKYSETTCYRI